jgi:hypothetical protein
VAESQPEVWLKSLKPHKTRCVMTFWIATINPYKYAKSQVPHELIAFKTRCPNQQKAVLASSVL